MGLLLEPTKTHVSLPSFNRSGWLSLSSILVLHSGHFVFTFFRAVSIISSFLHDGQLYVIVLLIFVKP